MAYNLLDVIDRASPRSGILTSELQLGSISGGEEEHEHCDETQHHDIRFSGRITRLSADPAKVHDDCSTTSGGRPLRASSSSRGSAASSSAAIVNRALPSLAVSVLKEWLLDPEHIDNPYPSDQQKEELAMQTGLSVKVSSVAVYATAGLACFCLAVGLQRSATRVGSCFQPLVLLRLIVLLATVTRLHPRTHRCSKYLCGSPITGSACGCPCAIS